MNDTEKLVDPQDRSALGWLIAVLILGSLGMGGAVAWKKGWFDATPQAAMNTYHVCYIYRSTNGTYLRTFTMDSERMDTNFITKAGREIHRNAGNQPSEILIINIFKLDPPQ